MRGSLSFGQFLIRFRQFLIRFRPALSARLARGPGRSVARWPWGGPDRFTPSGGARQRDAGMSTAEYAVGTIAAAALAAVLYQVVTSGAVSGALQGLVERALNAQL